MTPEFGQAARALLAGEGQSSQQIAERATQACERLATHLARLLGDTGTQLLLRRSVAIASLQFPWLVATPIGESAWSAARSAMEQQDPETITESFVAILAAFVDLLERLIGEGLVARLLDEVWPTVFTQPPKDTQ